MFSWRTSGPDKPSFSIQALPFNIRARMVSIELGEIDDIGESESMLGLSKQIWIRTRKGPVIRFVVWRRAGFIDAVKRQIIPENNTWLGY